MSRSDRFVRDSRPARVNWDKLDTGPTKEDLREIPATTADDWKDAEIVETLPDWMERRLTKRKQAGRTRGKPVAE